MERGELLAHGLARDVTRIPPRHERRPSLEDERLHPCGVATERLRDLRLRQVAELVERERGALLGRQRDDVAHHRPQRLAPLHLRRNGGGAVVQLRGELGIDARRPALANRRQGVVARDVVEPGTRVLELRALAQHAVGGQERLLDDVLGRCAVADVLAREREQAGRVAVIQIGEGPLVALAGTRGEGAITMIAGLRPRRGWGNGCHVASDAIPLRTPAQCPAARRGRLRLSGRRAGALSRWRARAGSAAAAAAPAGAPRPGAPARSRPAAERT